MAEAVSATACKKVGPLPLKKVLQLFASSGSRTRVHAWLANYLRVTVEEVGKHDDNRYTKLAELREDSGLMQHYDKRKPEVGERNRGVR